MTIHVPHAEFFAPPVAKPKNPVLALFGAINAMFERALDEGCPDDIAGCRGSECAECAAMRAIK
jgi:hypothetical protein